MTRRREPSVHILADAHLQNWPIGDTLCRISYFQHLSTSQWIEKLKRKTITIRTRITVLYMQKFRNLIHPTPLKNRLAQVCRAVLYSHQTRSPGTTSPCSLPCSTPTENWRESFISACRPISRTPQGAPWSQDRGTPSPSQDQDRDTLFPRKHQDIGTPSPWPGPGQE